MNGSPSCTPNRPVAARVAVLSARQQIDRDRFGARWWRAVQHLHERRQWHAGFVAEEPGDRGPRGVTEQLAQRHRRCPCERVVGDLPADQLIVDRSVERQRSARYSKSIASAFTDLLIDAA